MEIPADLFSATDEYIESLYGGEDAALLALQRAAQAAGLPEINVSPSQGRLLHVLAVATGATRILELGTLAGYSTLWLARALARGGTVVTVEMDHGRAELARDNLARSGVADLVQIVVGNALDVLPQLARSEAGPFDMIFLDADKQHLPEYLEWAIQLGRSGTLIVADNVIRKGAVMDADSDDPATAGARRFNALLARHPRLSSAILQTVGCKGHDGLAIAVMA